MSRHDQDLNELWSCFFNGPLPIVADADLVLGVLVRCMPLAPPYTVGAVFVGEPTGARQNGPVDPLVAPEGDAA